MRKKPLVICLAVILILVLFTILYAPVIFQEGNPLPLLQGIVKLQLSEEKIIPVSNSSVTTPAVYITKTKGGVDALLQYMKDEGWTMAEQLGSGYVFKKHENTITVISRQYSRFYQLWKVPSLKLDSKSQLASKLQINDESVKAIDKKVRNNGITMTLKSSYTNGKVGILLLTFTKDNGEVFYNSMNPGIQNYYVKGNTQKELNSFVITELSEGKKILYCYLAFANASGLMNETISFNIENLHCNQSQVDGVTFKDEIINGKWSSDFTLDGNDDTITLDNTKLTGTVAMCGKKLQINSATIANMAVIIDTTVLEDKGLPSGTDTLLSSAFIGSGTYYGVSVKIEYKNGVSTNEKDCFLDQEGNIIAWFFEPIELESVKKVVVGDVTILKK